MIVLKTLSDIRKLSSGSILYSKLYQYMDQYFHKLRACLSQDEPEDQFSLEQHGYIVILEESDNIRDLHEVGLNPEDNGLLGSWPEFVNLVELEDISLYQVGILFDNEYMQIFYVPVGMFDPEAEAFLREYAEDCM